MNFGTPIPLGKIFGVMVRLDPTLFILAAIYGVEGLERGGTQGLLDSLTFMVLLFFCIYLHEMGHSLAASLFGIGTIEVALTFFGGYARYAGAPRTRVQQAVMAFGGPAANLLIAATLYWYASNTEGASFLVWNLAYANLFLAVFNLLPAFPFDGGRIAAAALSNFMSSSRARVVTGYIGVAIGFLLIAWSLSSGSFGYNVMVGLMIILAASQEIQAAGGGRF